MGNSQAITDQCNTSDWFDHRSALGCESLKVQSIMQVGVSNKWHSERPQKKFTLAIKAQIFLPLTSFFYISPFSLGFFYTPRPFLISTSS